MKQIRPALFLLCFAWSQPFPVPGGTAVNIRDFGAKGDGTALDHEAINRAIEETAKKGGGTVVFPMGTWLCGSIRLKSHVHLKFEPGSVIKAADPKLGVFDETEDWMPPAWQDGGHTYFRNSLMWGEDLTNISITGPGLIQGKGSLNAAPGILSKMAGFQPDHSSTRVEVKPVVNNGMPPVRIPTKAIALKNCRGVSMRDFTIAHGGWFAILATGTDRMLMDNLTIDTQRDGIDIDACSNVRVTNCRVNSPDDDGICPKSTHVLGYPRPTEDLTIIDCTVSGYELGTLLDGTRQPSKGKRAPNGRIKFGTESSGGFRNCRVLNCRFESSMGLALEEVDGAVLENIVASNLRMKDVVNYAIYITTGNRNRTPHLKTESRIRNILIQDVVAEGVGPLLGIQVTGMPGLPVEGITLERIRLISRGGGTAEDARRIPNELGKNYPDPSGKGALPAYGLFVRHGKNLVFRDMDFSYMEADLRPAGWFDDVEGMTLERVTARVEPGVPVALASSTVNGVKATTSPTFVLSPMTHGGKK